MATQKDFIGTWKLLKCEHLLDDGEVLLPLGPNPVGFLFYSPEGYMNGALMNPDRMKFKKGQLFSGSLEEKAEAMAGYISYAGKYQVEEKRVLHFVEVSLFPNWVGSAQQRFYRFFDDKLELSTNAFVSDGVRQTAKLLWQRL